MTSRRVGSFVSRGLAVVAALALSLGLATTAQAHSVLLETVPANGTQLEEAPDSVSLTFNEDITNLGTEVIITHGEGNDLVSEGPVDIKGPTITQALGENRPEGLYKVTWRAVSADGHPISGVFYFTASADPNAHPEIPTAGQSTTSSYDDYEAEGDAAATAESTGLAASTWVIIGVLVAAALILVVTISRALASSRRKE